VIGRGELTGEVKSAFPEARLREFDPPEDGAAWAVEVAEGGPHLLFTYGPEVGFSVTDSADLRGGTLFAPPTELATLAEAREFLRAKAAGAGSTAAERAATSLTPEENEG
jgi:hypothetical protein